MPPDQAHPLRPNPVSRATPPPRTRAQSPARDTPRRKAAQRREPPGTSVTHSHTDLDESLVLEPHGAMCAAPRPCGIASNKEIISAGRYCAVGPAAGNNPVTSRRSTRSFKRRIGEVTPFFSCPKRLHLIVHQRALDGPSRDSSRCLNVREQEQRRLRAYAL